jgi:integrase
VPRRRFQRGSFIKEPNGGMYSMHYIDAVGPDGSIVSKQVKRFLGNLSQMSERAARAEHAKLMVDVNLKRGSVRPVPKGQTLADAVTKWRQAISPNLSPATVRPRESFLRTHIMPRFGRSALQDLGVHEVQQFATDLRQTVSGKTVVNVLSTLFAVIRYADKCGMRVAKVGFADLTLGSTKRETPVPFFTREQAGDIIGSAKEPFKTLFALAWYTGMRAGELLALTVADLDFDQRTIRVNKSADDNTREIRLPKTKSSVALLPMPTVLADMLRNYLLHWRPNPAGILFPTRDGSRPRSRDNMVKVGLKPVLRKLGIPTASTGLHAFRHGLATELAEASVPITVLQNQMRHADVKTTLKVYAHVIPQSQRDAIEALGSQPLRSNVTLLFKRGK